MTHYQLTGGCSCGNFRFEFKCELAMAVHCHCKNCQKSSGTGSAAVFATNRSNYVFTGKTSSYKYIGDSGKVVERHFCPTCGSPLFSDVEILPDMIFARIASLDEPSQIKPSMHIYCDSSQVWDRPNDHLAKFGKMPN